MEEMEAELCSFLALALDGWEWSASRLNHFNVGGNIPQCPLDNMQGGP